MEWIKHFEEETAYFEITDVKDKISMLKIYGRLEVKKLARNLPDAAPAPGDNDYKLQETEEEIRQPFSPEDEETSHKIYFQQTTTQRRRECGNLRCMIAQVKDCEFGE